MYLAKAKNSLCLRKRIKYDAFTDANEVLVLI